MQTESSIFLQNPFEEHDLRGLQLGHGPEKKF